MVAYHGEAKWTVAESLRDMIDADHPELDFLPGSGYIFRNLRAMDIAKLSRNPALKAGFITLRQEAMDFMAEIAESVPAGDDLRRQTMEYVLRVYDLGMEELRTRLRNEGHNEMEALVGTIAETLLEQGEVRGLAKGRAQGEALGLAKGKAETFLHLAQVKFGDIPAARADEVRAADAATLDRWLEVLIGADTLDEIFDPRRRH